MSRVYSDPLRSQNHAIIFWRGTVIQAIDANQEGYLEEALKLTNALREFGIREPGASSGPAIVGFREHNFSNLGALGDFAAGSEACFGSLVQRTMASPLWCRYHCALIFPARTHRTAQRAVPPPCRLWDLCDQSVTAHMLSQTAVQTCSTSVR
jgi:hypothetical protein